MIALFGSKKPVHPMAELKDARAILADMPSHDPLRCVEELSRWLESMMTVDGFKAEYRTQLVRLLDETAQIQLRALEREYLASPRLAKAREINLWKTIYKYWCSAALAYTGCIDLYASRARGADALKDDMPLLLARTLRALAAQVKWIYVRYGPVDPSVWGVITRIFGLAEAHKFAQSAVTLYPDASGETTPEREFLGAVMLAAASPNSLLPLELELGERLIAHVCAAFTLRHDVQPDSGYWIDLGAGLGPLRRARVQQSAPSHRFFGTSAALKQLDALAATIRSTGTVPAAIDAGGDYPVDTVLDVIDHLMIYWAPNSPERMHERRQLKSRLNVTHGYDGVLAALGYADDDGAGAETWIVENVSAGGFGAGTTEIKGDWLKIGCLLGLQPEGGDHWVLGVIRRLTFGTQLTASVGIQIIASSVQPVQLRRRGDTTATSGMLISDGSEPPGEMRLLLRGETMDPGQALEYQQDTTRYQLLPQETIEHGEDYQVIRCRVSTTADR